MSKENERMHEAQDVTDRHPMSNVVGDGRSGEVLGEMVLKDSRVHGSTAARRFRCMSSPRIGSDPAMRPSPLLLRRWVLDVGTCSHVSRGIQAVG
jgi:hypothetical protein